MKGLLLLSVCLMLVASLAFAQPGSIGLFADPGATSCDVYDVAQELIQIFVVHVYTQGAMASQFMVDCTSWGANLVYIGETSPFVVVIGDAQSGVAIGYGACVPSPNLLLTINYLGTGTSRPCSYCQVVPHPAAIPAEVLVVDCADPPNLLAATGGDVVVNPDWTCYCDIPVEETNWGRVKALYQ